MQKSKTGPLYHYVIKTNLYYVNVIRANMRASASRSSLSLLLILGLSLSACERPNSTHKENASSENTSTLDNISQLSRKQWRDMLSDISITVDYAKALNTAITDFLATPNEQNLANARKHWQQTFVQYHQLKPFLFLTDASNTTLPHLTQLRANLSHWPFYPGFLDSYGAYLQSGLVNNMDFSLNRETLRSQHQYFDADEITLGFYPMEFLLWGEQGGRKSRDFIEITQLPIALTQADIKLSELPQNRRRKLLQLQGNLLLEDLKKLQTYWEVNGQLSIAYHRLSPAARLNAVNMSTYHYLLHLSRLLLSDQDVQSPSPTRLDGLSGSWLSATRGSITALNRLYSQTDNPLSVNGINPAKLEEFKRLLATILPQEQQDSANTSQDLNITDIQLAAAIIKQSIQSKDKK